MDRLTQPVVIRMPARGLTGWPFLTDWLNESPWSNDVDAPYQLFVPVYPPSLRKKREDTWVKVIDMNGFGYEDIKVKAENNLVKIQARREIRDGENYDAVERFRTTEIPEKVESAGLSCKLGEDGRLILAAPFKPEKVHPKATQQKVATELSATQADEKQDVNTEGPDRQVEIQHMSHDQASVASSECRKFSTNYESEDVIPIQNAETALKEAGDDSASSEDVKEGVSIVDTDSGKEMQIRLLVDNFPSDSLKIRCHNNVLRLDAVAESQEGGFYSHREVHRQFPLPENAQVDKIKARMNDKGYVVVSVPTSSAESKGDEKSESTEKEPVQNEA